ncbi:unnamed protein product [Closterium sp. NIES-65]|nr:unnamed protein product [Closterium sp. NIES-65]
MALIPSSRPRNFRNRSVLPAFPAHPPPACSPHTPRSRFLLGSLHPRSIACQELMPPVSSLAPSFPLGASFSRSTYNGPFLSPCIHFTFSNLPRLPNSPCTMAEQIYNSDQTMSAAEEEALVASGEDLAVDDLPEGMFHHLADPADLPAAKKPCMVPDASPAPNPSPSTSSGSAPALSALSPAPLTVAALTAPSLGLAPSLAATAAPPNGQPTRATAYAFVASGSNLAPTLPASLFASPTPGGAPRNLRRARTNAAAPMLFPLRRRAVINVLLPEAGLEPHRSEIFAGINAQLCGFMFSSGIIPSFEQTVGDPYRVARRVYGRLLFSWPSQEDAAAFRKLFPLTLKVSNSRPLLLKVFEDRFAAFTAAKAAGAPTLSIRNVPLDFDPEDIRSYLLGSTDSDGAHWLADLADFHRVSDPYEDTYFTHLAGLPIATPDDPNFERIPSEIPLEENKPPMVLNFSSHVCALCANNHRASDHEAFAARRRQRLTNRNVISVAQLQKANGTLLENLSQRCYLTFSLPYCSGPLVPPFLLLILASPPLCYITPLLFQSYSSHSPCSVPLLPHPPLPSQLGHLTFSLPLRSGPLVLPILLSIPTSPPPCYTTPLLFQSYSFHSPCSVPLLPHPPPPSQLCHLTLFLPFRSGPLVLPFLFFISASPPPLALPPRSSRASGFTHPTLSHRYLIPLRPPSYATSPSPYLSALLRHLTFSLPHRSGPLALPFLLSTSIYLPPLLHYLPALPESQPSLTLLCPSAAPSPSALPAMSPHLLRASPLWSPRAPLSDLHFGISPPPLHYLPDLPELQLSPHPSLPPLSPLPANSPPREPSSVCSLSPRLHSPHPPPPQPSAFPAPLAVDSHDRPCGGLHVIAMLTHLRILCINVNGINETRKMDELKSWLSRLPAPTDLVILIDTRLILRIPNLVLKFRPLASTHAPALLSTDSARGRPTLIGGISILSFNRAISLSSPLPSADGRLLSVHLNYLRVQIRLIAIYAPTQFYERRLWWTTTLVPALETPTAASASMLAGDFNSVILPNDRNRPPKDYECREGASFAKLMDTHSLVDTFRALHPTPNDVFSFFGRQRHNTVTPPTSSRLDRTYISRTFLPRLVASPYLQTRRTITDHLYAPLCSLCFTNPTVAPRPWRLRQHLLTRPHAAQIIDAALVAFPSSPSPDSWDNWKLDLTLNFKRFSNQEKRRVDGTTAHLEHTIGSLQLQAAYTPLNQDESSRLHQARLHLARYEASKASEIALKAKFKVEGHREMGVSSLLSGLNSRIKGSIINSLTLPNGQTTSDLSTMTNMCSNFFLTLYSGSNPVTRNPSFWQHIPPSSIPNPLLIRLSTPFSLAEIRKALLSLSRGKTPGPDGLPGELFRQYSPRFAPAFHSLLSPPQPLSRLPPSMLTGRTVLIPKRGDSSLVENLRPITLINADYKVLALCLANRLQLVLPQLIHPSQTAFIKHRKIGDTINDTLDIMDWAAFSSSPLLALTVDFRKAYDLVDRSFLLQALYVLGLPTPFIHWVRLMHSETYTRVSVNNMLGPTFPVRTGVRQGFPLAPLLFVCVIEIFHRYMSLSLPGFALSSTQRRLMACYADDVTPFLTSDAELRQVVVMLGVFGSVSSEVPNWNMSDYI